FPCLDLGATLVRPRFGSPIDGRDLVDSKNYVPACQVFLDRVKFDERSPEGPPDGSPYDADKLAAVVSDNAIKLPASYRTAYVAPLLAALPTLTKYLKHRFEEDQSDRKMSAQEALADVKSISDSLVGVVRDWGFTAYRQPLRRFEAVISNLYRAFLSGQQRVQAGPPVIQAGSAAADVRTDRRRRALRQARGRGEGLHRRPDRRRQLAGELPQPPAAVAGTRARNRRA